MNTPQKPFNPLIALYAEAGRKGAIEKAHARRQEIAHQRQAQIQACQQLAAQTRHSAQALRRLTAALAAVAK